MTVDLLFLVVDMSGVSEVSYTWRMGSFHRMLYFFGNIDSIFVLETLEW
jgi:hypothetical protein